MRSKIKAMRRRLSDELPFGVECALPKPEAPPEDEESREQPRSGFATKVLLVAVALLALFGVWQLGQGLYTHLKDKLAQVLVSHAWERTLAGERQARPWPWADTWPVARLSAPERGIQLYVLAGANGYTFDFGPGHVAGSALPGETGNSVIGGQSDTHLVFLRDLKPGNDLLVQRPDGAHRLYRVQGTELLDEGDTWVTRQDGKTRLTLITCYPFDAQRANGPLRYVVFADALDVKG